MRCAIVIGVDPGRVGVLWCRCVVRIGGTWLVWCVVWLCHWDSWGGRSCWAVWCRCAAGIDGRRVVRVVCGGAVVGIGAGRVVLDVSGVVVPWGLVGGVSCW